MYIINKNIHYLLNAQFQNNYKKFPKCQILEWTINFNQNTLHFIPPDSSICADLSSSVSKTNICYFACFVIGKIDNEIDASTVRLAFWVIELNLN
jgi:hypothetical protein